MHRSPVNTVLLLLLIATKAMAWGGTGHRITGYIAESLLSESARQQVGQLLGDETLAAATTYMDVQRDTLREHWPASERWHYDNQPACGQQHDYCADGNCATRQIERWRRVLADHNASQAERAMALRLLVHMLGDIHQPLHMADNLDRGGNNIDVRLYASGERYKLHEVMDTILIKQQMGNQRIRQYANQLRERYHTHLSDWQRGDVTDWAAQTHQLAVTHSYGMLPNFACGATADHTITLPRAYVQDAMQYLPEQVTKAGVRIAAVLNATLP